LRLSAEKILDDEYQCMVQDWVERCREAGDNRPVLDHIPDNIVDEVLLQAKVLITSVKYDVAAKLFIIGADVT
jgi:hypothetical protein